MIREIVVYIKIKPYLKQLRELSSMTLTMSRFLQMVGVALQILNILAPIVREKEKPYVAAAIGVCQVLIHNFAGKVNPDGTPAQAAYIPPAKK